MKTKSFLFKTSPPIITHTAATPQDSPSNTLEEFPEFNYSITGVPLSPLSDSLTVCFNQMDFNQNTSVSIRNDYERKKCTEMLRNT